LRRRKFVAAILEARRYRQPKYPAAIVIALSR
jgi:hypothetical protein